jgi:hypothetical protein
MAEAQKNFWGVHSEKDGKPVIRAWAKSEAEANALVGKIKAGDSIPEDEYWVTPLSERSVAMFKESGFIPADA